MYSIKKLFSLRRHMLPYIIFLMVIVIIILYKVSSTVENSTACHYVHDNDALPSAEDKNFLPGPHSIFFHETSCRGGLNSRQACSVEAAARAHPERQVYVMFSGPVSEVVYQGSSIAKLRRFANVRFARVHIADYARNTPLEDMVLSEAFNNSQWKMEHTSDVLRSLTLYKWGGLYMDTDMLAVKSLTPLGYNWVATESEEYVNTAAIAISMDSLGRKLAESIINELKETYTPDVWAHNGPGVITRVLSKMCITPHLSEWSATTCQGLGVYGPEYLFPLYYPSYALYFAPGELTNVEKAYTHHFWNKLNYDKKIHKDSPYEKMAKKYCPTIYEMYGDEFGSPNINLTPVNKKKIITTGIHKKIIDRFGFYNYVHQN